MNSDWYLKNSKNQNRLSFKFKKNQTPLIQHLKIRFRIKTEDKYSMGQTFRLPWNPTNIINQSDQLWWVATVHWAKSLERSGHMIRTFLQNSAARGYSILWSTCIPVHDELDELLPELLPVLPGLGIALELGLLLLGALAPGFLPEQRRLFWWIRPWNKTGFIIQKVQTLDRQCHILSHQKSRPWTWCILSAVYTVKFL